MLTRHAKAYGSFCSQIALVYLQPFRRKSLLKCTAQPKIAKPLFECPWEFRVFQSHRCWCDWNLVTSAFCDRQHIHACLQPFSR